MKIFFFLIVFSVFSLNTYARDGSGGCGLGWQVTNKKSLSATTTRATTHAVLPNTLSMTSGTSGCAYHGVVMNDKAPIYYAEANYEMLTLEIAKGKGEYLKAFAKVLNCNNSSVSYFSKTLQHNYNNLFEIGNDPLMFIDNVRNIVKTYSKLSNACQHELFI